METLCSLICSSGFSLTQTERYDIFAHSLLEPCLTCDKHVYMYLSRQIYSNPSYQNTRHAPQHPYSRSSFLLRYLVRFISFLYLCFFIFSFLCLLTLIARQTSLEFPLPGRFTRQDFSQANRRVHMRFKNGWYGGGQRDGVWWWLLWPSSINNCSEEESSRKGEAMRWYVVWPSGCVRSTTVTRVE